MTARRMRSGVGHSVRVRGCRQAYLETRWRSTDANRPSGGEQVAIKPVKYKPRRIRPQRTGGPSSRTGCYAGRPSSSFIRCAGITSALE